MTRGLKAAFDMFKGIPSVPAMPCRNQDEDGFANRSETKKADVNETFRVRLRRLTHELANRPCRCALYAVIRRFAATISGAALIALYDSDF